MEACPTIIGVKTGRIRRHGEQLLMAVRADVVDEDNINHRTDNIIVIVPCALVRDKPPSDVVAYVGKQTRNLIPAYGPISFQRLSQAIIDNLLKHDLRLLAGEKFLIDMEPMGRA